jgi:hypothetical protein
MLKIMKDIGVQFDHPKTGTASLNRVLHCAESSMPSYPLENPMKTKEMFEICLAAFEKLHNNEKYETPVINPNPASYEIFFRSCSRLPEGETRSKLSAKAFDLCKQKGLVTPKICEFLYTANPSLACTNLKATEAEIIDGSLDIPESWKRNAPQPREKERKY